MTDSDDLLGWQNTRWDMSHEILETSLVGKGVERLPDRLNRWDGKIMNPSAYPEMFGLEAPFYDLLIRSVFIGSVEFKVKFLMESSINPDVFYAVAFESVMDINITLRDAKIVKDIISEKFGAAKRVGTTEKFRWMFPTTTITYMCFIADRKRNIHIIYQPTLFVGEDLEGAL